MFFVTIGRSLTSNLDERHSSKCLKLYVKFTIVKDYKNV